MLDAADYALALYDDLLTTTVIAIDTINHDVFFMKNSQLRTAACEGKTTRRQSVLQRVLCIAIYTNVLLLRTEKTRSK